MRARALFALLVLILTGSAVALALQAREDLFPHEKHVNLFPLCEGCHEGVSTGDRVASYPPQALCARCHNGTDAKPVRWMPPARKPTTLKFSHPVHVRGAMRAADTIGCAGCHAIAGNDRMTVRRRAEPDQCLRCHAHRATSHFVDSPCEQCHVPLAESRLTLARIDSFPMPDSHRQNTFLEGLHGKLAASEPQRCSVCHTRETCASCHVDIASNKDVQRVPTAPSTMSVPTTSARYPKPASHRDADWTAKHGALAKTGVASCATCHTQESCATCHTQKMPAATAALPRGASVIAPGVTTVMRAPTSHLSPQFDSKHGALAASRPQTCAGCHAQTKCESCHTAPAAGKDRAPEPSVTSRWAHAQSVAPPDTPQVRAAVVDSSSAAQRPAARADTVKPRPATVRKDRPVFHPANFTERHASASFGRNLDCQNCHETARFCRACHEQRGMGPVGRLQGGFHDAQPNWLLNHGRPARQGLESCASCHTQRDCTQCHSETGAFRINPHGPGFDAERLIKRNPTTCFACHLGDPLRKRS